MASEQTQPRFVVCVSVGSYPASLEARKVYQTLPDGVAESDGMVRVIDESGEDYLFPASLFAAVELSQATVMRLSGEEAA